MIPFRDSTDQRADTAELQRRLRDDGYLFIHDLIPSETVLALQRQALAVAWRGGDFAAGDAVIFHSLTVHRGSPNLTDRLRLSADFRFQRASDPITPASCQPFVTSLTWEEIYAGWSNEAPQYYWRNPVTRHVDYDMKYFNQRDEAAFALAESGDATAKFVLLRITQNDLDPAKRARAVALLDRLGVN